MLTPERPYDVRYEPSDDGPAWHVYGPDDLVYDSDDTEADARREAERLNESDECDRLNERISNAVQRAWEDGDLSTLRRIAEGLIGPG